MSGAIPLSGQKALVDYAAAKLQEKDQEKRLAEAEKKRIRKWQAGFENDPRGKQLPHQKPLPPIPMDYAALDKNDRKRDKVKKLFRLYKDPDPGVDFSAVFGAPIMAPRERDGGDGESLTALPPMPVKGKEAGGKGGR